jgi:hypothetical protein
MLTVFVFFNLGTIMTVPTGLVPLQDVLVAKGTPAPFDGTDKITPAQMSNGVVRREGFFLQKVWLSGSQLLKGHR